MDVEGLGLGSGDAPKHPLAAYRDQLFEVSNCHAFRST
jgi:hypothetical protein